MLSFCSLVLHFDLEKNFYQIRIKTESNSGLSQLASELPFSFHLAAKGKCPPEGLQAQNTANWLTSEPTFAYLLLLHICSQLARSKVCQFSAGKLLLNLLAYSIIIIFSSKCMSGCLAQRCVGQAQQEEARLQNYFRKTHFASKVRAILQHCTISFWLDSYLICMYVVLLCTTIPYYLLMYFP